MSKQDGWIERLDTRVSRLNSVCDVREIARENFERECSWFDDGAPIIVEFAYPEVRVFYVHTRTSNSDQRTFVDCRFHLVCGVMWIGSIQVAARHRLKGVGRQLVRAAEATANALGIEEVKVLPMLSSVDFWLKLGYAQDPHVARVRWKNLRVVAQELDDEAGSRS